MIRIGMALTSAALIGCIGPAAAGTDAKCNEAAFKKRHGQLSKAYSKSLNQKDAYKGDMTEIIEGKVLIKKDYCAIQKGELTNKLKLLRYERENIHCLSDILKNHLEYSFKTYYSDVDSYQEECGHHKL